MKREHESMISHYRLKQGLTVRELAALAGVVMDTVASLNNGTQSPLSPRGNGIKRSAQKIADALEVPVGRLFPRYFCNRDLTVEQVRGILHPERGPCIDWKWIHRRLNNKRMFLVLRLRFIGWTLQEIGDLLGVTKERVRQIEKLTGRLLKS